MNRIDIQSLLLATLLPISFALVNPSTSIVIRSSNPICHTTISPFVMPPSRRYAHQQKRDGIARKRHVRGHGAEKSSDAHTNHTSRLVLSKYYSRPSRISDEENSSDSKSSADISTIHVVHANQHANLSPSSSAFLLLGHAIICTVLLLSIYACY